MRCVRNGRPSTKFRDDIRGEQFQCFPIILERAADPHLHTRVLISSNQVGDGGDGTGEAAKWLARVKLHALSSQRRSFCANSSPITTVFSIAR